MANFEQQHAVSKRDAELRDQIQSQDQTAGQDEHGDEPLARCQQYA